MLNRCILLLCFVFSLQLSYAQIIDTAAVVLLDSTSAESTAPLKKKKKEFFLKRILKEPYPSAKKAALLSIILPGAGQAYNKKYWKIPIVYAGIGSLVYAINWNGNKYREFRQAYRYRVDGIASTVDNFQGDENRIIIVSLVRNKGNDSAFEKGKIGFVGIPDRINVLSSRAKEGI